MIKTNILLLSILFCCLSASMLQSNDLPVYIRLRQNSISDRDLLGTASRWQAQKGRQLLASSQSQSITETDTVKLKVLAIRVEFQDDDDEASTGNGRFDFSARTQIMVDPPPHDKTYFEAQLQALSNYYRSVSKGKLIITGLNSPFSDVYPLEQNAAYQLPHDMPYYGTDESDLLRDKRLVQLFHDAWTVADEDNQIDFAQYDCFIVFHAGVGGDLAFDFDETPYDISSVFLSFADLKENFGSEDAGYQGISVQNGSVFIRDGIILPETQNQNEIEFGLLGTGTLMFGSQIGLPSLFNTETGLSGIGKWGLMDQGSGNFTGLIPAQPCAWSKIFMGWEKPIPITNGQNIPIAAALAANPNKIYKIPINAKEYFLIENRQQHLLKVPDLAVAYDQNGVRVEMKRDGTFMQRASDDTFRVFVKVDEYDFDCPGSGILIWHIDENVIEEKYAGNSINNDPDNRGVDLEEAHGSQDIGGNYGLLHPASGSENGIQENAFWNNNESNLYVNDTENVAFTPTSNPGSWSNSRANTHIFITNFSEIDSVMSFDLHIDLYQAGFPETIGPLAQLTPNSLFSFDLDGNGTQEILAASTNGKIYGWNADGSSIIPGNFTIESKNIKGETVVDTVALFANIPDLQNGILHAPTVVDINGDGQYEVAAVTKDGAVYCFQFTDANSDGEADLIENFPVELGGAVEAFLSTGTTLAVGLSAGELVSIGNTGILWRSDIQSNGYLRGVAYNPNGLEYFVTSGAGDLIKIDTNGTLQWSKSFGVDLGQPVLVDHEMASEYQIDPMMIIVPAGDESIKILSAEGDFVKQINLSFQNQMVDVCLADINQDGLTEIVTISNDMLYAYRTNGVLVENFPVDLVWDTELSGFNYAPPVIGDLANDGNLELVAGTQNGNIQAYHFDGQSVNGFPLPTANAVKSMPLLADIDGDQDIELAIISGDNALYVWDFAAKFDAKNVPWGSYLGNAYHWAYTKILNPIIAREGELIEAAYNYPNPTEGNSTTIRYQLTSTAEVTIKIYDLAGELIDELKAQGNSIEPEEIIWNLDNIESGVYFARIFAEDTANGKSAEKIIKIAVVK